MSTNRRKSPCPGIRPEHASDARAIGELTLQAFASLPYSSHTEHFIVRALREAKALTVSLLAEHAGQVVGHIAFSPVTVSDGALGWYGLGPVSVLPSFQRRGIGRALIEHGLSRLRELGACGCVVLGAPSFYGRFGFTHHQGLVYPHAPPEFFLAQAFRLEFAKGTVEYHHAFAAKV
jgi:putative acetyltransferase